MTQINQTYLTEIILITDAALFPVLGQTLLLAHPLASPKAFMLAEPILKLTPIHSKAALDERCCSSLAGARLITCGTDILVSEDVIQAFDGPSYNIHPGLPNYPGRFPSVFSIYDGAEEFGTTVHELAAKVDSGPIVAIDRFPMPENVSRADLETLSFYSVIQMLAQLTPKLVSPAPLPHIEASWSGQAKRQVDFDNLCKIQQNISEDEFHKRLRAVGEGPDHALEFDVYGHRFRLDNRRDCQVVVGGQVRNQPIEA